MFWNYLITAFRNLVRGLPEGLMNISGLAIGIAVCTYIFIYVRFESGYDRYHQDYKRIYRLEQVVESGGNRVHFASPALKVGNVLKEYDEVEEIGRAHV